MVRLSFESDPAQPEPSTRCCSKQADCLRYPSSQPMQLGRPSRRGKAQPRCWYREGSYFLATCRPQPAFPTRQCRHCCSQQRRTDEVSMSRPPELHRSGPRPWCSRKRHPCPRPATARRDRWSHRPGGLCFCHYSVFCRHRRIRCTHKWLLPSARCTWSSSWHQLSQQPKRVQCISYSLLDFKKLIINLPENLYPSNYSNLADLVIF